MTEQPADQAGADVPEAEQATCCGQGGAWVPPAGSPVIPSCQLCPRSPTYWRAHRAED